MALQVKVCDVPVQMLIAPPGETVTAEGSISTVTAKVLGVDEPQALSAVTEIVPLFVPTVVVIELVEDVPVQPFGNVHV